LVYARQPRPIERNEADTLVRKVKRIGAALPRIVVGTPSAVPYVLSIAKSAEASGQLARVFTAFIPPSWTLGLRNFPIPNLSDRMVAWLRRKSLTGIPPDRAQAVGQLSELLRAAAAVLPLSQPLSAYLMYRGKASFDRAVARQLRSIDFEVAIGHYASSSQILTETRRLGRVGGLVFENSHPMHQNRLLQDLGGVPNRHHELIPAHVQRNVARELELANIIFVPSHYVRRQLEAEGVPPDNIAVERYGVDPLMFQPLMNDNMDLTGRAVVRCLYVGQISHRKGIALLVEAARRLRRIGFTGKTIEFRLIGPLVSREVLNRAPDNVRWLRTLGHDQIAAEMRKAQMFVLPSLDDAYPLVTLEAMASGLPVIVSDHAGTSEIIVNGQDGIVIPAGNVDSLVQAIAQLAVDSELRRTMGEAARRRSEAETDWDAYGKRVLAWFERAGIA
jgi:glycosyltransferase involved in cell wall biosynthesis